MKCLIWPLSQTGRFPWASRRWKHTNWKSCTRRLKFVSRRLDRTGLEDDFMMISWGSTIGLSSISLKLRCIDSGWSELANSSDEFTLNMAGPSNISEVLPTSSRQHNPEPRQRLGRDRSIVVAWPGGTIELVRWELVQWEHRKMEVFSWENHRKTHRKMDVNPLVICYIAIENGHRNSEFSH